jgi:hypothetical protein
VSFEVSASGVAERPAVLRSSQFSLLDEAALNHMKDCLKTTANETSGTLRAAYGMASRVRRHHSFAQWRTVRPDSNVNGRVVKRCSWR